MIWAYLTIGAALSYWTVPWEKGFRLRVMKTSPMWLARLAGVPAVVLAHAVFWPLYLWLWFRQPRSSHVEP